MVAYSAAMWAESSAMTSAVMKAEKMAAHLAVLSEVHLVAPMVDLKVEHWAGLMGAMRAVY